MDSPDAVPTVSASHSRRDPIRRTHWATLLLLLGACAAARFWCLVCKPFWFDEAYSVELARIDWRNFVHLLWWREANMSLYYLLLRIWLHFGQSPFFIRGLSVVLAAATLPALYWLAGLLYDRRVAVIAAALFAFNAYSVRYAQEARSYALFLLLTTLSSGFLVAWIRHPTRNNRLGYILASVLGVYAHFYGLLLIAAQWIALRWTDPGDRDPKERKELERAWIVIGVGVLPLLVFVAKTGPGPIKWIQRPGLRDVIVFYEQLAGSTSWSLLAAYGAACGVGLAPLGKRLFAGNANWAQWRSQFLLIWLLFPVALTVLLSFARPVFLARYMIFTLPALVILAAAGLARLRSAWLLGAALAMVLALNASGIAYVYGHDFDSERDSSGAATAFILDHGQPGDGVIFHIASTRVAYEFFRSLSAGENTASPYFTAQLGPEILYPHHGPGMDYRDFTGKPTAEFVRGVEDAHPRIWLMLMNNGPAGNPDPTTHMLSGALVQGYPKVKTWTLAKVELRLYSRE